MGVYRSRQRLTTVLRGPGITYIVTDRRGRPWYGNPYVCVRAEMVDVSRLTSATANPTVTSSRRVRGYLAASGPKVRFHQGAWRDAGTLHRPAFRWGMIPGANVHVNAVFERAVRESALDVFGVDGGWDWHAPGNGAPLQFRRGRDGMVAGLVMPLQLLAPGCYELEA